MAAPRFIQLVHSFSGRIRLRLSWLREDAETASALGDALAALPGVGTVTIRPRTGSVLCEYDPETLREDALIARVRRATRVTRVIRPGEAVPAAPRKALPSRGTINQRLHETLSGWNQDLLHTTEGRLDLGSASALGFLGLGALEMLTMRPLPAPPWFNLAWWAFRTLTIFDEEEKAPRKRPRRASRRKTASA